MVGAFGRFDAAGDKRLNSYFPKEVAGLLLAPVDHSNNHSLFGPEPATFNTSRNDFDLGSYFVMGENFRENQRWIVD